MWYSYKTSKPVRNKCIAILLDKSGRPTLDFVYNIDGEYHYLGLQDRTIFAVSDESCDLFDSLHEYSIRKTCEIIKE